MTFHIRPAAASDAEIIIEFNRRLARETEAKELPLELIGPGVQAMLADPAKGRYFVAEDQGQVIGQLGVTLEWSDWRNGNFWWLQSVYVRADHRRRGVFRGLFAYLKDAAKNDPETIGVRLYVEPHNDAARRTYASLGFRDAGYELLEIYPLSGALPG